MERACKNCKVIKDLDKFTLNKLCKYGREHTCKACTITRQGSWEQISPNSHKNSYYKWKHGVTKSQYDSMFERQGGVCAVCRNKETGLNGKRTGIKALCIDHDHKTGAVRELLCNRCNTALGSLREDLNIITNLVDYIKKHRK